MNQYMEMDKRLHLLSQVLAKAGRSYAPKRDDDGHTNLCFDALGDRISGRWITGSQGKIRLTLNLSSLQYEWLDTSAQVLQAVPVRGKYIRDLEKELSRTAADYALMPQDFSEALHFQIPAYPFAEEMVAPFGLEGLDNWRFFRHWANEACTRVLNYLQVEGEIRIWPHHFDTGIYVQAKPGLSLGFGFAMQDSLCDTPYYYLSGYADQGVLAYESAGPLEQGRWESGAGWKGAMLPVNKQFSSEWEGRARIDRFIVQALTWLLKQ